MKKTTLISALLLTMAAAPALAQPLDIDDENDEGRSHLNLGPDRDVTKACKSEATQKGLSGKDRRRYVSDCQKREPTLSSGASGGDMTASSGRVLSPMRDADGRYPQQDVAPSHFGRAGPSASTARPAIPDVDAEGRPRPR